jgi:hypothetical protein
MREERGRRRKEEGEGGRRKEEGGSRKEERILRFGRYQQHFQTRIYSAALGRCFRKLRICWKIN